MLTTSDGNAGSGHRTLILRNDQRYLRLRIASLAFGTENVRLTMAVVTFSPSSATMLGLVLRPSSFAFG
jgi:hypothetical protein